MSIVYVSSTSPEFKMCQRFHCVLFLSADTVYIVITGCAMY